MVRSRFSLRIAYLTLAVLIRTASRADDQVPNVNALPLPVQAASPNTRPGTRSAAAPPSTQPVPSSLSWRAYPPAFAGGIPVQEMPDPGPQGVTYEELHWLDRLNPFRLLDPSRPVTVDELCKRLDCVAEKLRDEGLVVIKQPDVFSQSRLTRFRYDFDQQLSTDLGNFHLVLAARINRLDAATTTQTTALSASLAAPGTTAVKVPDLPDLAKINANGTSLFGSTIDTTKGPFGSIGLAPNTLGQSSTSNVAMGLGVDPTVYLDEKKRFLEHLNHIRRLNLGPDQNDSSGYGLYLLRLPISITPGECTYQGFGAEVAVKVEHEFTPDFLPSTFKDLVINDLADQLAPFIYEAIRSGFYEQYLKPDHDAKERKRFLDSKNEQIVNSFAEQIGDRLRHVVITAAYKKSPNMFDAETLKQLREKGEKATEFPTSFREYPVGFPIVESRAVPPPEYFGDKPPTAQTAPYDIERIVAALDRWIFLPSTLLTGESRNDRTRIDDFVRRLTVLAEAREGIAKPFKPDSVTVEFRELIDLARKGEAVDKNKKPLSAHLDYHAMAFLRVVVSHILAGGSAPTLKSLLETPTYDKELISKFIAGLYLTALPIDVKGLNNIVGVLQNSDEEDSTLRVAENNEELRQPRLLKLNFNLPSVRSAKQSYPIAPRELIQFFLPENFYLLAKDTIEASRTKEVPRSGCPQLHSRVPRSGIRGLINPDRKAAGTGCAFADG